MSRKCCLIVMRLRSTLLYNHFTWVQIKTLSPRRNDFSLFFSVRDCVLRPIQIGDNPSFILHREKVKVEHVMGKYCIKMHLTLYYL